MSDDFVSHLEELRKRIFVSLIVFFFGTVLAYFFSGDLIELLIRPLRRYENAQLIFQTPYEAFFTHLKVAALAGLIFSSPVLFTQFWLFVTPGLLPEEKKVIFPLAASSLFLFLAGAAFSYFLIIPWCLHFLLGFQTEHLRPFLSIGSYFSFLLSLVLIFGVMFNIPVVVMGLSSLGLIRSEKLAGSRKLTWLIIFVLSAILTPPDPVSQIMLAVPILALFELAVFLSAWMEKKNKKKRIQTS